jgi:DNA-binding transcriptional regulator GbsR (MarR family)
MPTLDPVTEKFILHWGEMGTRWGVNRTVAQIHALLYLSPRPLNAEEIAQTLSVARSNVSRSLRELESWGIVRAIHLLGDRREHYQATKDVYEMARVILDERKRREIDPTVSVLRDCLQALDAQGQAASDLRERLTAMLAFVEMLTSLYEQISKLPTGSVRTMLGGQGRLGSVLAGGPAVASKPAPSKSAEHSKSAEAPKPTEILKSVEAEERSEPGRSAGASEPTEILKPVEAGKPAHSSKSSEAPKQG